MKKTLSILLAVIMLFSLSITALAADYDQVFDKGTLGSETFRIPALYTLNDGSVIAAADMRHGHGSDSPNNIESLIAISEDGYAGWEYQYLNRFDDYKDGLTEAASASFIDMAIAQDSTGKIYVIVDAQPAGCGYRQCKQGTGYTTVDGEERMLLTDGDNTNLSSFEYYIGEFIGEFAPVYSLENDKVTEYSVDAEFNLYKNGKALTTTQKGSDETVQQNVFFADSPLKCFLTTYLWLRTSTDGGKTWSAPEIITGQVKHEGDFFLGICPGRGITTTLEDGTERIIFTVYDNGVLGWNQFENVSTIYSDDGGITWDRGAETVCGLQAGKTSESQIVELNDGVLRMYARNNGSYIAYADSTDGGITWTDFVSDLGLPAMGNCMCSFINTSKIINGKPVILGSFPSNTGSRAGGVIKVGLVNSDNSVSWISTYKLTKSNDFFAYSCMTELKDGNFGILYEDEAAHISYLVFSIDEKGNINEINGNNPVTEDEAPRLTFWQKIVNFFKTLFAKLFNF